MVDRDEIKHTPGPWRIQSSMGSMRDDGSNPYTLYGIAAGRLLPWNNFPEWGNKRDEFNVVEISFDRDYGYPEGGIANEANARLIAAAPEMLEALEWVIAWEEEYRTRNHLGKTPPQPFIQAVQAIRKARGE